MKRQSQPELSIVITAHHEGLLAHKTILSVLRCAEQLEKQNIAYEIIVGLDNPDCATENYYKCWADDARLTILRCSFSDPAANRNHAVRRARGKYISLIDGDDLISQNFYIEAYKLARQKTGLFALRPNIQLQFGVDEPNNAVWVMGDSFAPDKDALIMMQFNRWAHMLVAPREVFDKVQFVPAAKGYGYEDYQFNAEMLAAGIPQFIVPQTTFFYRRMAESKQSEHIAEHTILPYTKLFDFECCAKIDPAKILPARASVARAARAGKVARKILRKSIGLGMQLGRAIKPVGAIAAPLVRNRIAQKNQQKLPAWFFDQWREMNQIENQLWPTAGAVAKLTFHLLSFDQDGEAATRVGRVYRDLVRQFTKKPDYIFFTYDPLGAGGTEKVLSHYISAIKKSHPDWQFAIFRAKPADFPFEVPDGVDFIDFFGATEKMHPHERDILFDRLIIQSRAKRLHFFFNGWAKGDYSYNWVRQHRKLLRDNNYAVNISWFMREFVPESEKGRVMTFADPWLGEIYDAVNKVFTDNQNVIDESLANNAFDPAKFVVHYQPADLHSLTPPKKINPKKPLKILWAGRLSHQKRLDILRRIAEKLDASEFQIDAYGREQNYRGKYLAGIPALNYRGTFSGFDSLPTDQYDVFLFTSQVDGLPNVLLEATAAGLPIVASNDGGVREFVRENETGKLVEIEDINGYITALQVLHNQPELASKLVANAQRLLKQQHSLNEFDKAVRKDIN